jgi:hypothetical protein
MTQLNVDWFETQVKNDLLRQPYLKTDVIGTALRYLFFIFARFFV